MSSLTLKRYNSFQNKNNRKATHSFTPRPLMLPQEVLKFKNHLKLTLRQIFQTLKIDVL